MSALLFGWCDPLGSHVDDAIGMHSGLDRYGAATAALAQPIVACPHVFDDTEPIWFIDVFDVDAGLFCCHCDVKSQRRRDDVEPSTVSVCGCARCGSSVDPMAAHVFPAMVFSMTIRRLNASRRVEHTVHFFGLQCESCALEFGVAPKNSID
jgi:hypothetical protein